MNYCFLATAALVQNVDKLRYNEKKEAALRPCHLTNTLHYRSSYYKAPGPAKLRYCPFADCVEYDIFSQTPFSDTNLHSSHHTGLAKEHHILPFSVKPQPSLSVPETE
jgi:hypothetical protein